MSNPAPSPLLSKRHSSNKAQWAFVQPIRSVDHGESGLVPEKGMEVLVPRAAMTMPIDHAPERPQTLLSVGDHRSYVVGRSHINERSSGSVEHGEGEMVPEAEVEMPRLAASATMDLVHDGSLPHISSEGYVPINAQRSRVSDPFHGREDHEKSKLVLGTKVDIAPAQASTNALVNPATSYRAQTSFHRPSDDLEIVAGRLYRLPLFNRTQGTVDGRQDRGSVLWTQPHVNSAAGNHYTMVYDSYADQIGGRTIARCFQMTSFTVPNQGLSHRGKRHFAIDEKYTGRTWHLHLQYVPIRHSDMPAPVHDMPVLEFKQGARELEALTYVHLDHFFEIETEHLREDESGPRDLDDDSFSVVIHRFHRFVHRSNERRQTKRGNGLTVPSPLDLNIEVTFAPWIAACSVFGRGLEDRRISGIQGGRFWSGWESTNYVNRNPDHVLRSRYALPRPYQRSMNPKQRLWNDDGPSGRTSPQPPNSSRSTVHYYGSNQGPAPTGRRGQNQIPYREPTDRHQYWAR